MMKSCYSSAVSQAISPPKTCDELLGRARALSGRSLCDLAKVADFELPSKALRGKGRTGELIERLLGADGGSRPVPDFSLLGVELKTLPVRKDGRVLETTFVCSASFPDIPKWTWETSRAYKKLKHVLFVPVEGSRPIPIPQRRVGSAFFWKPSAEDNALLARDWKDFQALIVEGLIDATSARRGKVLQVRPKAKNSLSTRQVVRSDGDDYATLPRGFYLRRHFVQELVERHLALGP